VREYLVLFTVAAAVTYLLAIPARGLAVRVGAVAAVRDRDVHAVPIPFFGGLAMLGGLWAAYLTALHLPFLSLTDPTLVDDAGAVLVGGTVICLVGVIDDVWELDALTKFVGQVAASTVVIALGVQFYYLPLAADEVNVIDPVQAAVVSILLIVGTVNAVNFVDGLDGLAAGVVCIGAVAFFGFAYVLAGQNSQSVATPAALLTAALAGACVGFLPHNFFPARMFMGDSGSMLIGLVLACSAITLTGQFTASAEPIEGVSGPANLSPTLLPLVLPVAMLLVPFADLALAVIRRTRAGRSPFSPDKQHLHHRLLEIGHSQRRAVLVMYLLAALIAFGTVALSLFSGWRVVAAVAAAALLTLAVAVVLPRVGRSAT
jgi:UDP-GlcNAc:undecaprenyl-phosphate GlcNAc-1-phosphate transferase